MARDALITGACGFIGRHVARRLEVKGWRVTGVGHGAWSRDQWRRWGVDEWYSADITLESLITYGRDPALIVHCAGSASVGFSVAHPYQDFQRTTSTTASVLEYARVYAPRSAVVLLSSAAVYGATDELPTPESVPGRPISPYGVHKQVAERLCQSYARQYSHATAIVRLFSIYGPGLRKQLLWDACNKLSRGETRFSGTGAERRDWLNVEDAAELLVHAAERASAACPIANGGSGIAVPVRDVLQQVARSLGRGEGVEFSGDARRGDPMHYQADIAVARSWGWEPTIDWRAGVQAFVEWFQAGAA